MKLVQFYLENQRFPGVLVDEDRILNLYKASTTFPDFFPEPITCTLDLLQQGDVALQAVKNLIARIHGKREKLEGLMVKKAATRLTAPIHNPQKIIAIGLNYRDHCEENNLEVPKFPVTFAKHPSAIIGPEEPITWPPDLTQQVDYEAEFAFVMGKKARCVPEVDALDYVAGYTIVNDVSARDLQFAEGQWVRAKSLDTFCPLGPVIVTREEIPDPHSLEITCEVNGTILQHSNTRHLIFGVAYLVSYLSKSFTLYPGDIVTTGTPGGVGYYQQPQLFLKPGDVVKVEIEKIGALVNPVVAWSEKDDDIVEK